MPANRDLRYRNEPAEKYEFHYLCSQVEQVCWIYVSDVQYFLFWVAIYLQQGLLAADRIVNTFNHTLTSLWISRNKKKTTLRLSIEITHTHKINKS